ncbi:cytochrome P450 [Frankia sp. AgPm24]|nr:cytochrome P450 [Frankia sp. AgPm24]
MDRSGWMFVLLRRFRPILSVGPITVVTRSDDVRAVLGDHEHFTVALYTPKMAEITGPFIGSPPRAWGGREWHQHGGRWRWSVE